MFSRCISLNEQKIEDRECNEEIDRRLKSFKNVRREHKILLLGTGDSGKSTFIKQLRIIHGNGYDKDGLLNFIPTIHENILTSLRTLTTAMVSLEIPYETPGYEVFLVKINEVSTVDKDFAKVLNLFWADPGVQKCYLRRNEFQLLDSTK